MDIVRAFEDASLERGFHLNIQGNSDNPLFQAKQIGEILGLSNIRMSIKDFDEDEKVVSSTYTPQGGQQDALFLTDLGLFRLLGLSRKPIARPFQKWVGKILREIRLNGKYELSAEHSRIMAMKEDEIVSRQEAARHDALISSNDDVGCIYFMKVMKLVNGFVFKMGETDNIRQRMIVLKSEYGMAVLLDVFQCIMPHKCEQNLRSTPNFKSNQYTGEVNGKSGTELYVSGQNWPWYKISKSVKNAVEAHMSQCTTHLEMKRLDVESRRLDVELERLRIISSFNPETLQSMVSLIDSMKIDKQQEDEHIIDDDHNIVEQVPRPFYASSSNAIRVQGQQVQRYSPDGKTLLTTYETLKDAERDPHLSLNRPHSVKIIDAIKLHRVYKGFRWANLPHGESSSTVQDIGITVAAPTCRRGKVVVLDNKRKIIQTLYDSMTVAAKEMNVSIATISLALSSSVSLGSNKFCVAMFNDCSIEMREAFENNGGIVIASSKPSAGNAKSVDMLGINGDLLETYTSISSAEFACKLDRRRIFNAIESKDAIKDGNGKTSKWRYTHLSSM